MAYPVSTSIHLTYDKQYRVPVEKQIERIVRNGFEYLDFNFLDWQKSDKSPFLGDDWQNWITGAGETAAKLGAAFNQAHAPYPCYVCEHDPEMLQEFDRRAVIGCSMLGIPWMVHHLISDPKDFAGSDEAVLAYNREFFAPIIDLAHKYNVGVAFENVWPVYTDWPYSRTEQLIDFADSFHDDLVGICWDTGHGNLTCNSHNYKGANRPELLPYRDQYANITKIGKRLKCLHINDNNGMDDDHIPPFLGTICWADVIRALDDIGYEHSFTFETHNATLRFLSAGIDGDIIDHSIRLLHEIGTKLVSMSRL